MLSFKKGGTTVESEQLAPEGVPVAAPPAPVVATSAAFPRVNLIPEQVAIEARTHLAKRICFGTIAASAVVVGGLFFLANSQVSSAQNDLDTATARSAALAAQATKYADVPRVNAELASAQSQLSSAMGSEVQWSTVLYNLALSTPQGVSLDAFKATVTSATPGAAAAAPTSTQASSASVLGNAGIGTMDFDGTATDWPHVSSFLDSVTRSPGALDPWATQVTNDTTSGTSATGVKYTAGVTISSAALSHRYDAKGN
jgi:hypothetical protein